MQEPRLKKMCGKDYVKIQFQDLLWTLLINLPKSGFLIKSARNVTIETPALVSLMLWI